MGNLLLWIAPNTIIIVGKLKTLNSFSNLKLLEFVEECHQNRFKFRNLNLFWTYFDFLIFHTYNVGESIRTCAAFFLEAIPPSTMWQLYHSLNYWKLQLQNKMSSNSGFWTYFELNLVCWFFELFENWAIAQNGRRRTKSVANEVSCQLCSQQHYKIH